MLILHILHYITGYLVIDIRGRYQERFFNVCLRRGLHLWQVERLPSGVTRACIGIGTFFKLGEIACRTKCYPHIVAKCGLPFALKRRRGRVAFVAGLLGCLCVVYCLSTLLWVVNITGTLVDPETVRQQLQEAGLRVGSRLSSIDPYEIEEAFLLHHKEYAFVSVNLNGTVANVEVTDAYPKPEILKLDEPCDIVASRDGVVKRVSVLNGEQTVNVYDVVRKGQLLVSGTVFRSGVGFEYLRAAGEVVAQTTYEATAPVVPYVEFNQITGEKKTLRVLRVLNMALRLYWDDSVNYSQYDTIEGEEWLTIGGVTLPVGITRTEYHEVVPQKRPLSTQEALTRTVKALYAGLDAQTEEAISVQRSHTVDQTDKGLVVTATYTCEENIAEEVPFTAPDTTPAAPPADPQPNTQDT